MIKRIQFFVFLIIASACNIVEQPVISSTKHHEFDSYADFKSTLLNILNINDLAKKEESFSIFWDSLKSNNQIPFVFNDSVMFLYNGDANEVSWAGDFNGWRPSKGIQLTDNSVWKLEKVFPLDARLDYKVVVEDKWILDPDNSYVQYSGWGPNSELRMPEWKYPEETMLVDVFNRGDLSDNIIIDASEATLDYKVQYKVYTPFGYDQLSNLPVIYVTDGHEYADDRLGSMIITLDNLIQNQSIQPIIAVFIDPRDPDNFEDNKRELQYTGNRKFVDFIADELVSVIDGNYKTDSNADARAILGTSLGGWNSGYIGVTRSDKFHLLGIHSPAFDDNLIADYNYAELLPLKIFMSTGVIYDTQDKARAMKEVLDAKGYPLKYIEVNEGHSWGNWRALIKEPLIYFFAN